MRWALVGGLLTGLAYLTRSAAVPMLAAAPLFFLLRKRLRLSLFFFAGALPLVAGWQIWTATHAAAVVGTPYLDEYLRVIRATGLGQHLLTQLSTLSASVAEAFLPGMIEFLHGVPLHHLVLAAAISGGVRLGRRQQWPLFLIFTALYLVMITCWWFQGLGRLLVPVWPMLLVGIAEEASHFATLAGQSMKLKAAPRWALVALGIFIVLRNDRVTWQKTEAVYATERGNRARDRAAYTWIAEHNEGSIVLAWKDTVAYLYTGLPSSHDLFVATIPQAENLVGLRGRPSRCRRDGSRVRFCCCWTRTCMPIRTKWLRFAQQPRRRPSWSLARRAPMFIAFLYISQLGTQNDRSLWSRLSKQFLYVMPILSRDRRKRSTRFFPQTGQHRAEGCPNPARHRKLVVSYGNHKNHC